VKKHLWLAAWLSLLQAHFATAALSGLRTIGGDYNSITAALADIRAQTLDGPLILEVKPGYSGSVETFPIVFTNLTTTADNTLTIRLQSGPVVARTISANVSGPVIDLSGAQYVTIDGSTGGSGSDRQLTIANLSISGVALRFINGSSNNIIRNVNFQGANNTASSGVILFSTNSGTGGNNNNLIDNCVIRDHTSSLTMPVNGLYSLGSTNSVGRFNRDNTVQNCSIFNFFANNADAAGIRLDAGNTDWTISGNSFFQTNSRNAFAGFVRPIYVNNTNFGNNFTVTGNFIGGSAVNAGGTNWANASLGGNDQFVGIQLNVATNTPSSVQGNTIANFLWQTASTTASLPGVWSGIYVVNGAVDIGTITGNTIGQDTGTNSIIVMTSANAGTAFGISSDSRYGVNIFNNQIGAITTKSTGTTISTSLAGIQVNAGTNYIVGNLVGSLTSTNSLNAAVLSTSGSGQFVAGILSASAGTTTISNNTVANLNDNYVGSATLGQVRGIFANAGINTITDNTVRNLVTLSTSTGTSGSAALIGIAQSSTGAGQTIARNHVHSLVAYPGAAPLAAAVSVLGIYYSGGNGGVNVIARNLLHSFEIILSSSSSSVLGGIQCDGGIATVQNNMVCLGLSAAGFNTASASAIRAIQDNGGIRNCYYNSVYIGGNGTSTANSFAFGSLGSGIRDFRNNIFYNARHRTAGSGNFYAISLSSTNTLTCDANIYYVDGLGGVLGRFNSGDCINLGAWQAATKMDISSLSADPLFNNPATTADSVDLHLQDGNPAAGAGQHVAAVSDDFDGETRSRSAPDIGADETVSPNNPPTAGDPFTLVVELGVTKSVTIVGGTNAPSDPDGDALIITQVTASPDSVASTDGTNVFFTGLNGTEGSFTYTVTDDWGATASQTVDVIILPSTVPGFNQFGTILTAGGTNRLSFLGAPNFEYALEQATNLQPPIDWQPKATNTAAANGLMSFTNAPGASPVFYRTRFVP